MTTVLAAILTLMSPNPQPSQAISDCAAQLRLDVVGSALAPRGVAGNCSAFVRIVGCTPIRAGGAKACIPSPHLPIHVARIELMLSWLAILNEVAAAEVLATDEFIDNAGAFRIASVRIGAHSGLLTNRETALLTDLFMIAMHVAPDPPKWPSK